MENIIKSINEKSKKLKLLLKNPQTWKVLEDWLLTELAYTSNAIEGNTLTRKETALAITEHITSTSKPIKYYVEAQNHAEAFKLVIEMSHNSHFVTVDNILAIHKIILKGLDDANAGRYRNVAVHIFGSSVVMPNASKVYELMKQFGSYLQTEKPGIDKAIISHLHLVSIHPFIDGNGRTARLLMNLLLLKDSKLPLIIRPRDRRQYLKIIEKAQLYDERKDYMEFMYKALDRSLQTYLDMFDEKKPDVQQNKLLKISQFAKAAGVPVSTIRYYLRVGKIKPITKTDSDYMLFSPEQIKEVKK